MFIASNPHLDAINRMDTGITPLDPKNSLVSATSTGAFALLRLGSDHSGRPPVSL